MYICDTPMNRRNLDSRALNVRGKDIPVLEFCKASGLKIVNGPVKLVILWGSLHVMTQMQIIQVS